MAISSQPGLLIFERCITWNLQWHHMYSSSKNWNLYALHWSVIKSSTAVNAVKIQQSYVVHNKHSKITAKKTECVSAKRMISCVDLCGLPYAFYLPRISFFNISLFWTINRFIMASTRNFTKFKSTSRGNSERRCVFVCHHLVWNYASIRTVWALFTRSWR